MRKIFLCMIAIVLLAGSDAHAAQPNMALEFKSDSNSFFEAPDDPVFHQKLGNELTIEAWIFVTNDVGESMIVNKEDSWEFADRNGTFQSALNGGGGWAWFDSALQVKMEEWTHVAMTWDGKDIQMFVNGKEGNPSPSPGKALNATNSTFKVGRRVRGDAVLHSIFDGLVDEVRISKGLRYKGKYDVPEEGFEPDADTLALYHFDEEVGGKIIDFSNSGVDGKLVGKAKLVPSDAPTALAIEARDKLATLWGKIKRRQ